MRRFEVQTALICALLTSLCAFAQDRPRFTPDQIHRFEEQEVRVPDFPAEGYVLDIGGGGEGIIGQLKPKQVIAIDLIKRELAEAPAGPLKIVMDATDMKFLDGTFQTVTSFFSLMYMKEADQEKVFREVRRVLVPGGRFLIWDVDLPVRTDPQKEVVLYRFKFQLPGKEVKTGYGTMFPDKPHNMSYFAALAGKAGLRVESQRQQGRVLTLTLSR